MKILDTVSVSFFVNKNDFSIYKLLTRSFQLLGLVILASDKHLAFKKERCLCKHNFAIKL